jgi:hypothetical protein
MIVKKLKKVRIGIYIWFDLQEDYVEKSWLHIKILHNLIIHLSWNQRKQITLEENIFENMCNFELDISIIERNNNIACKWSNQPTLLNISRLMNSAPELQ